MMKILTTLVTATLLLGLTQTASAGDPMPCHKPDGEQGPHHHSWQGADANKDGVITRDEFIAAHKTRSEKMFTNLDTNNDGSISRDEFMSWHEDRPEKMFTKLDSNNDGKVDEAEQKSMQTRCDRRQMMRK